MLRTRAFLLTSLTVLLSGLTSLAAAQSSNPVPVTVVTLEAQDVTLFSELPGRVAALGVAEVRPQVSGIVVERLFQEGGTVQEGDAMYRIDDDVYDAQVQQATASVAQAKARLTAAEKEEQRVAELLLRNVASQQAVDSAVAERDAAKAALLVAQAQLQTAKIDLQHTTIRAPLSGRVGRALATQGALVTAQQAEPLAVIRQIDRVYVDVAVSTQDVLRFNRAVASQTAVLQTIDPTVTVSLADGSTFDQTGTVLAAEPQVDPQTGVSVLRIEFPNPNQIVLPGMYVTAHLPVEVLRGAVLAPQQGVARNRRGQPTAMVVDENNTVAERLLTVRGTEGNKWIVTDGLKAGDRLIVAGLQKIGVGATVAPTEEPES
ncbi:efflux RND transporter periplasmic adaptor subunit [Ruegeria arenilitoris]|uniref:efflux RND transporter periplasmic adaptor subunit n=1 Tax=Ruegeria arenilitoris TaxID=1173585 RepID=UPI00147E1F89|nr:efflux RND transporter periplasmic adaptor subunit [Ruegeria arenilitoris]